MECEADGIKPEVASIPKGDGRAINGEGTACDTDLQQGEICEPRCHAHAFPAKLVGMAMLHLARAILRLTTTNKFNCRLKGGHGSKSKSFQPLNYSLKWVVHQAPKMGSQSGFDPTATFFSKAPESAEAGGPT